MWRQPARRRPPDVWTPARTRSTRGGGAAVDVEGGAGPTRRRPAAVESTREEDRRSTREEEAGAEAAPPRTSRARSGSLTADHRARAMVRGRQRSSLAA